MGVPFHRYSPQDIATFFPQFDPSGISYALYEPEAGMVMAHRALITGLALFRRLGGTVLRGRVTTDETEFPMLDCKRLEAELIVIATGPWMAEMFPKTIKPI